MSLSSARIALDDEFTHGQRAALIEGYQQLAEAESDAGLFRRLGICYADTGRLEDAKEAFRRAVAIDHSDTVSKRRLARLEMMPAPKPAKPARAARARKRALSQAEARDGFLRAFPLGFADPKYLTDERNYKWDTHELWQETLARPAYDGLLASGNYAEICTRLKTVIARHKLNLPSPFELIALNDLLTGNETQQVVAEEVRSLVYDDDFAGALERAVLALQRLKVKGSKPFSWPIVTLFPFIADPARHMFVKPTATKAAAARLGIELNYKPVPNPPTYERVLDLVQRLKDDLQELKPRDLIDIQSFIWVTDSAGYDVPV